MQLLEGAWLLPQDHFLLGFDEVGRGPLAGPVVACGVCQERRQWSVAWGGALGDLGITDSKRLSAKRRAGILRSLGIEVECLEPRRIYCARLGGKSLLRFVLTQVEHQLIDRINILQASLLAMKQCYESFALSQPALVLVDGSHGIALSHPDHHQVSVVGGDGRVQLIALASIIAKQYRDNYMKKLAVTYPGYGLESHFGYPTLAHRQAIRQLGPSAIHRRSFKGV